jgi:hypothetical protein
VLEVLCPGMAGNLCPTGGAWPACIAAVEVCVLGHVIERYHGPASCSCMHAWHEPFPAAAALVLPYLGARSRLFAEPAGHCLEETAVLEVCWELSTAHHAGAAGWCVGAKD